MCLPFVPNPRISYKNMCWSDATHIGTLAVSPPPPYSRPMNLRNQFLVCNIVGKGRDVSTYLQADWKYHSPFIFSRRHEMTSSFLPPPFENNLFPPLLNMPFSSRVFHHWLCHWSFPFWIFMEVPKKNYCTVRYHGNEKTCAYHLCQILVYHIKICAGAMQPT